ncbi:MAG TPA: hypothetical protein VGU20_25620 [Stellaceae bacterium]|nr:hypothetical protein [Stellaceae bacterium]
MPFNFGEAEARQRLAAAIERIKVQGALISSLLHANRKAGLAAQREEAAQHPPTGQAPS